MTRDVASSHKAQTQVFELLMFFLSAVRMLQAHDNERNDIIVVPHFFERSEMSHCGVAVHGALVLAWRLFLVVVGSALRRCVQSQVRSPR